MNPIALIRAAGNNASQKHHIVAPFLDGHGIVPNPGTPLRQTGQFVIMGGKNCFGAYFFPDILDHGAGNAHPIERTGATTNFVQNNQAAGCRMF